MTMERRLFVRFLMSGIVIVQPDPESKGTIDCELINLSYDGLGIYSSIALKEASKVKFILINRQLNVNISGFAKVAFCNPVETKDKNSFRIGLKIIDADRDKVKDVLMRVREIPESER